MVIYPKTSHKLGQIFIAAFMLLYVLMACIVYELNIFVGILFLIFTFYYELRSQLVHIVVKDKRLDVQGFESMFRFKKRNFSGAVEDIENVCIEVFFPHLVSVDIVVNIRGQDALYIHLPFVTYLITNFGKSIKRDLRKAGITVGDSSL